MTELPVFWCILSSLRHYNLLSPLYLNILVKLLKSLDWGKICLRHLNRHIPGCVKIPLKSTIWKSTLWKPQAFCDQDFNSLTFVDFQIGAQTFIYLCIIHLLKSSTCFEHYPAHFQQVYVVICIYIYICSLWYRQFFLNRCTGQSPAESDDTRGCIYIQLRHRPPEDEKGNSRNM